MSDAIQSNSRPAIITILGVSLAATIFLFWLLYFHQAPGAYAMKLRFLPALNAFLNGLSATSLAIGFVLIKNRRIPAHKTAMITAFFFSSLFLVSYIVHHALHGDSIYPGSGTIRTVYLLILLTHVVLSAVALPMILVTFFFSLTGRFPQHKKIARYTFPIWLYVSVTGVVVYAMLAAARG